VKTPLECRERRESSIIIKFLRYSLLYIQNENKIPVQTKYLVETHKIIYENNF